MPSSSGLSPLTITPSKPGLPQQNTGSVILLVWFPASQGVPRDPCVALTLSKSVSQACLLPRLCGRETFQFWTKLWMLVFSITLVCWLSPLLSCAVETPEAGMVSASGGAHGPMVFWIQHARQPRWISTLTVNLRSISWTYFVVGTVLSPISFTSTLTSRKSILALKCYTFPHLRNIRVNPSRGWVRETINESLCQASLEWELEQWRHKYWWKGTPTWIFKFFCQQFHPLQYLSN